VKTWKRIRLGVKQYMSGGNHLYRIISTTTTTSKDNNNNNTLAQSSSSNHEATLSTKTINNKNKNNNEEKSQKMIKINHLAVILSEDAIRDLQCSHDSSSSVITTLQNWIQWCSLFSHQDDDGSNVKFVLNSQKTNNSSSDVNGDEQEVYCFNGVQNLSFYDVNGSLRQQFSLLNKELVKKSDNNNVTIHASSPMEQDFEVVPYIDFQSSSIRKRSATMTTDDDDDDHTRVIKRFRLLNYESCGRPFVTRVAHELITDNALKRQQQRQVLKQEEEMQNQGKFGVNHEKRLVSNKKQNKQSISNTIVKQKKAEEEEQRKHKRRENNSNHMKESQLWLVLSEDDQRERLELNSIVEKRMKEAKEDLFPEPELLLVFSPKVCCLHGFSPIHLRYTQIIHVEESITHFSYDSFVRCLLQFAGCEQRYGV